MIYLLSGAAIFLGWTYYRRHRDRPASLAVRLCYAAPLLAIIVALVWWMLPIDMIVAHYRAR